MSARRTRIESDSMGQVEVSDWALWGAQTQRAVANFPKQALSVAGEYRNEVCPWLRVVVVFQAKRASTMPVGVELYASTPL